MKIEIEIPDEYAKYIAGYMEEVGIVVGGMGYEPDSYPKEEKKKVLEAIEYCETEVLDKIFNLLKGIE
jgi:hypothetical protein